ncbi:MAG: hypothetical protein VX834_11630 [Myxococcota bacterium]|nr:hypothetical protein [Myxococcota bacterium]
MPSAVVAHSETGQIASVDDLYRSAIMRFRFGNAAEGRRMLLHLLQDHPSHVPTLQLVSRLCVETGHPEKAQALLNRGLELRPSSVELQTLSAELRFLLGDHKSAREIFHRVVRKAPLYTSALVGFGLLELACGHHERAQVLFRRALATSRECTQAYDGLIQAMMPGPTALEVLTQLHLELKPANYLQLGVEQGDALRAVDLKTSCIVVASGAKLDLDVVCPDEFYPMTSKAFFNHHDLRQLFGGSAVDLAFLRGPSSYDLVLEEFLELERSVGPRTVLCVEGTYPVEAISAHRRKRAEHWVGDRWKLVAILKAYRPDLYIQTLPAAPSGLTLISCLDPESTVLSERFDEISHAFAPLGYDYLAVDPASVLNIVPCHVEDALTRIRKRWDM